MTDELVLYRADVKGLRPGSDTGRMVPFWEQDPAREYTFATTSIDAARAFAVFAFGAARDHERSVYRVQLDDPIVFDPEFRSDEAISFYMSHWGTVVEVVEETVAMTVDEAKRVLWNDARWVDDSRMFDDDGHATVPPKWLVDSRFDVDEIQKALRGLGSFPDPNDVLRFLEQHYR